MAGRSCTFTPARHWSSTWRRRILGDNDQREGPRRARRCQSASTASRFRRKAKLAEDVESGASSDRCRSGRRRAGIRRRRIVKVSEGLATTPGDTIGNVAPQKAIDGSLPEIERRLGKAPDRAPRNRDIRTNEPRRARSGHGRSQQETGQERPIPDRLKRISRAMLRMMYQNVRRAEGEEAGEERLARQPLTPRQGEHGGQAQSVLDDANRHGDDEAVCQGLVHAGLRRHSPATTAASVPHRRRHIDEIVEGEDPEVTAPADRGRRDRGGMLILRPRAAGAHATALPEASGAPQEQQTISVTSQHRDTRDRRSPNGRF